MFLVYERLLRVFRVLDDEFQKCAALPSFAYNSKFSGFFGNGPNHCKKSLKYCICTLVTFGFESEKKKLPASHRLKCVLEIDNFRSFFTIVRWRNVATTKESKERL